MIAHWNDQLEACKNDPDLWLIFFEAGLAIGLKYVDLNAYMNRWMPNPHPAATPCAACAAGDGRECDE